jgi:DNA-binding MarR family transcriptional regulator
MYLGIKITEEMPMGQDALHRDGSDGVDAIVEQWRRERSDLDVSAKQVTGRIVRLAGLFQQAYGAAFDDLGITDADYGILAPLRRAGAPFQLTPTELARQKMMTSGGMTAAIDRLERRGLVTRTPNPADRRGSLVGLTEEGRSVIDEAMGRHVEVEHQVLAGLGAQQRTDLEGLLRSLLLALEA